MAQFNLKKTDTLTTPLSGMQAIGVNTSNQLFMVDDAGQTVAIGGGGGLEGSRYVYVAANGTPTENAAELQAAYTLAKTKKLEETVPGPDIQDGTADYFMNSTNFLSGSNLPIYPTGPAQVLVTHGMGTETINIEIFSSDPNVLVFNVVSYNIYNVSSFQVLTTTLERSTVIIAPGYYNFTTDLILDGQNVNLVSLDGETSVIFSGTGTIYVSVNNVYIKGIDVKSKNFTIAGNLGNIIIEKCKGGDFSFGGDPTYGSNPLTVSGTFIDCIGANYSFGNRGIASGTFINCTGGTYSFGGYNSAGGTFKNCTGDYGSFGGNGVASGVFIECTTGNSAGFGTSGNASGTFTRCLSSNGFGTNGTASGQFYYCVDNYGGFGKDGNDYGQYYHCKGGSAAFGGAESQPSNSGGYYYYCKGGTLSFGGASNFTSGSAFAGGVYVHCIGDDYSFAGWDVASATYTSNFTGTASYCRGSAKAFWGITNGKLLFCSTTDSFNTSNASSSGGKIVYGIDGLFNTVNV